MRRVVPAPLPRLERRTPGETDLSVFTSARPLPSTGRHHVKDLTSLRVFRVRPDARPVLRRLAGVTLAALMLVACSSAPETGAGGESATATGTGSTDLRSVCPSTVVIQSSWFSQVEHFAAYQLLGKGYTVDARRKSVTGPLVSTGKDTGVKVQIRAGGPAIGFQQVSSQMYADKSITLGMVPLDEAIQNSARQPVTGIMTPYDIDPLILMWDPRSHPFNGISDIGQTDTPVLFFQGERTYMDYLLGTGLLRPSQVDGSYDGTPSRFVASRGSIVVQGFATSEPWRWEHEVTQWGKPLTYQLVADTGYPNYRNLFAIRSGERQRLSPCLHRLVPILQRATVDFMAHPDPTIDLVLSVIDKTRSGYVDSLARSKHAVSVMREAGLVTNGTTPMVGDFDLRDERGARVRRLLDIDIPIFAGQHVALRPKLTPADIATNEFLDSSIGLPRS